MAPNVNLCLVVLDVEGFVLKDLCWCECCYAICLEDVNYGVKSFTMYVCMALGM
jgi:hypothetical protein